MNRIILEAVPQNAMRPPYDSEDKAGDWFVNADGDLIIRAIGTDLDDPETFLFCLHELVEAALCRAEGVNQAVVDAFDAAYTGDGEPGDDPASPYRRQHRHAMLIEHLMASFMGLTGYGKVE